MHTTRQRLRRAIILIAFLALPVTLNYYSPYLMISGTAERVATFSLVLWSAVTLSALVLGRSFCGWGCPFNGLQQAWESVGSSKLKRVRFLPAVKYLLWAAWIAGLIAVAVSVGGWTRFDPLYMTEAGVSITEAGNLITYFMLVALTLAPAALGRRGFCRYLCPFGVWSIVGEAVGHALRIPRLRLDAHPESCTSCGTCELRCPMQLPVTSMVRCNDMRDAECFMCETCADVCPHRSITVGFGAS